MKMTGKERTTHKMRIGLHQVVKRPLLLVDVVKKLNLKALWLPDRKRILIDSDEPLLKHRWNEAHEIGHSIIPWHEVVLHGDNRRTLKPALPPCDRGRGELCRWPHPVLAGSFCRRVARFPHRPLGH